MTPLRSVDATAPNDAVASKWTLRMYSSKEALTEMPKLSWLDFVGQEIVPAIDFRSMDDFRQVRGPGPACVGPRPRRTPGCAGYSSTLHIHLTHPPYCVECSSTLHIRPTA